MEHLVIRSSPQVAYMMMNEHVPKYHLTFTRLETFPSMYMRSGVKARTGVPVFDGCQNKR